ncbi:hypothetical protein ACOME3_001924 [Neoechinorhynchus agilis]
MTAPRSVVSSYHQLNCRGTGRYVGIIKPDMGDNKNNLELCRFAVNDIDGSLGTACFSEASCTPGSNLHCIDGSCQCEPGFTFKGTWCEPNPDYYKKCTKNQDCDKSKRLVCVKSRCVCKAGYSWIDDICTKKYGTQCTSNLDCGKLSQLTCENQVCVCKNGMKWRKNECTNTVDPGGKCGSHLDCDVNLHFICLNGICQCKSGFVRKSKICIGEFCKCLIFKNESISFS